MTSARTEFGTGITVSLLGLVLKQAICKETNVWLIKLETWHELQLVADLNVGPFTLK